MYIRTVLAVAAILLCPALVHAGVAVDDGLSVLCVEAETGVVIFEKDASVVRPPASMVKMMLMLMVTEGLRNGDWTLEQPITATPHAASIGGSQVYLRSGETHSLDHYMLAVAVKSANDAATAVAEGLWGSEAAYLEHINRRARELGMVNSKFHSPHGLPPAPGAEFDQTTAHDMVILARHCLREPIIQNWVATKEFQFRKNEATLYNTNKLLWRVEGCDGLKTGFIRAAGFCVTATAQRGDVRLITVVMGHPNSQQRFRLAEDVFNYGFENVRRERILAREDSAGPVVPVVNGEMTEIALGVDSDVWLSLPAADLDRIEFVTATPETIVAPVEAGTPLGEVRVLLDGKLLSTANLVAPVSIEMAGWMWRIQNRINTFAGVPGDAVAGGGS